MSDEIADRSAYMADPAPPGRALDLPGLTSLRALAALLVFGYHLGAGMPVGPFAGGYTGVAFFFVLSGFVLTWGTDPTRSPARFYLRRFARIYPSHFVVWLAVLLLPLIAGSRGLGQALANLLLLQAWSWRLDYVLSMNGVTWSLSCEMFFYLIFPLVYLATRRMKLSTQWIAAAILFAAAGTVVVLGSFADPNGVLAQIAGANPLVRAPEFLLGVVAARQVQSGRALPHWTWVPVLLFTAAGLALAHGDPAASTWMAPTYMLVIVFVTQATVAGRSVLTRGWMVYAGKVSFAFYLVHQIVIKEIFRWIHPGVGQAAVALAVAVTCAVALHELVERPAQEAITGRFARKGYRPDVSTRTGSARLHSAPDGDLDVKA